MAAVVQCPVCGTAVPWTEASRWRPFCSERCKLIDLGDWASERHVIPGEPGEPAEPAPTETPKPDQAR
jgi:endogenous inhibitor of DNA gyrase (YacG/DUF329 family)